MITSENIEKLAVALSKAQGEMKGAKKDSKNQHWKSTYSDLLSVCNAVSQPFANNGLCFVQGAEFDEGKISVKTRLIHASGQWIESNTILPPTKNDVQGYASAITYGRRYGLQSLAGVPSVDDDGNDAVKTKAPVYDQELIGKIMDAKTEDEIGELFNSVKHEVATAHRPLFHNRRIEIKEQAKKDAKAKKELVDA